MSATHRSANGLRAYLRRLFTQWVIDGEAYASNLDRMDGRR